MGFGDSDRLASQLEIAEYALATLDALDELGVDQFDVIGVHTGSCEAIELATARPERVRRVGLVAVPVFTDEERDVFKARFAAPPDPAADGSHLLACWNFFDAIGAEEARPGRWDAPLVHWLVVNYLLSGTTPHSVFDYPTGERVQRIEQPLLVIATHDDIFTDETVYTGVMPAVQNLMLAARGLGLGTCLTTATNVYEGKMKELLGVPEPVQLVALMPLGYPSVPFTPRKRIPIGEKLHRDRW